MNVLLAVILAIFLDKIFAEPKRFHPLVGFGRIADKVENKFNRVSSTSAMTARISGIAAYLLAVLPLLFGITYLSVYLPYTPLSSGQGSFLNHVFFEIALPAFVLYLAIGWQSLMQHARAISQPLKAGQITEARLAVSMVVSRDTENLQEEGISRAATESILENGADAIFAAIFWFIVAGIPGVVLYRLSNTLDAMWGYKNSRFLYFGWAAARLDDVMNYIPARLTAITYALVGNTRLALSCWRQQAATWKSPNAGPVMSAGAGALNISLGGAAQYHASIESRPDLGPKVGIGQAPSAEGIDQACGLVTRSLYLWLLVLFVAQLASGL